MTEGSRYRDKEEKHGRGRTRLKYAAGTAMLLLTVLIALFLPGWYSEWREAEVMKQVVLEEREGPHLLDMEALDISTKLAMLGESEEFDGVLISVQEYGAAAAPDGVSGLDFDGKYQKLLDEKFSEWYECHLLPEHPFSTERASLNKGMAADFYVKIDDGIIPVRVLMRLTDQEYEIEIAVLDQSNEFLYYAGIVSEEMYSYIFQNMGVRSGKEEDLYQRLEDGTFSLDGFRDPSWYDYASVCRADSQEVVAADAPVGLFQNVKLQYEGFEVSAFRSLFVSQVSGLTGLQTMFGTDRWSEFASYAASLMGYEIDPYGQDEWVGEWNDMMLHYGREDLLMTPAAGTAKQEEKPQVQEEAVHLIPEEISAKIHF